MLHVSIGERDSGINHVIETIVIVFFHITFLNACCQCRIGHVSVCCVR